MSGRVRRTHVAEQYLAEQANYLGEQSPALAIRFLESAEETFALLVHSN